MKEASAAMLFLLILAVVPVGADDPPPDHQVFLPITMSGWQLGMEPNNLICNPGAEYGELCWEFAYPNTGNVLCGCDGQDCPDPLFGDCLFRFGGWYDMTDTGMSEPFYMEAGITYSLEGRIDIWTTELPLAPPLDTLDIYLIDSNNHYLHLMTFTNEDATVDWGEFYVAIGIGESGWCSLFFVAITDGEKQIYGGNTNFFIDALRLYNWGDCTECVLCQAQDEPPIRVCDQGEGEECMGCCPDGDDCAGLDPKCPVTKPPLPPYRVVGRETTCH